MLWRQIVHEVDFAKLRTWAAYYAVIRDINSIFKIIEPNILFEKVTQEYEQKFEISTSFFDAFNILSASQVRALLLAEFEGLIEFL